MEMKVDRKGNWEKKMKAIFAVTLLLLIWKSNLLLSQVYTADMLPPVEGILWRVLSGEYDRKVATLGLGISGIEMAFNQLERYFPPELLDRENTFRILQNLRDSGNVNSSISAIHDLYKTLGLEIAQTL